MAKCREGGRMPCRSAIVIDQRWTFEVPSVDISRAMRQKRCKGDVPIRDRETHNAPSRDNT